MLTLSTYYENFVPTYISSYIKPPLLFWGLGLAFLMPTSVAIGGNRPWYLFFTMMSILVAMVGLHNRTPVSAKLVEGALYLFTFSIMISLAILGSREVLIGRDFLEILKPFAALSFVLFGYFSVNRADNDKIWNFFLFVLVLECVVCLVAFLYDPRQISFLSSIWDFAKYRSWRGVGTFSNPNRLGFFTIILFFGLLHFRKNNILMTVLIYLATAALLVVSSSRTSLICWAALISLYFVSKQKKLLPSLLKLSAIVFVVLTALVLIRPYLEGGRFKYLYDFLSHFQSPLHFLHISSVKGRMSNWQNAIEFVTSGVELKWFIGGGPTKGAVFKILDNDYMYTAMKYGLLGALVFYGFWRAVFKQIWVCRVNQQLRGFLLFYIMTLAIFGLTSESFSSWILTVPFFVFYGVCLRHELLSKA